MFKTFNRISFGFKSTTLEIDEQVGSEEVCPNCGENPEGGEFNHGIVFGSTDGIYTYITCTHCNSDYKY